MSASPKLRKHAGDLRELYKLRNSNKRLPWLTKNCSDDFLECLCVCCKNIIGGRVPLTLKQRRELSKNKNKLRILASKQIPLKRKRLIVRQTGGFLGAILSPILSILGGLFGGK